MIGREYAVIAGGLILAVFLTAKKLSGKKTESLFIITAFVYFTAVISITFFPLVYDSGNAAAKSSGFLQLTPFHTIRNMIKYASDKTIVMQVIGNILMTIPYGILLPVMIKRKNPFIILPLLIALPVVIESMQWVLGAILGTWYRTTDIDDVILNFTGGLIGYIIYIITVLILKKAKRTEEHSL